MVSVSHLPVIISVMIVTYLILVGSVSWVAWQRRDDGLRGLALALCTFTLAYILFSLRELLPKDLLLSIYYCLLGQAYIFLHYGILKNFRQKFRWQWHEIPFLLLMISNFLFNTDHVPQVLACYVIYTLQFSLIAVDLHRLKRKVQSTGSNMLLAGMLLVIGISLWWLWQCYSDPRFIFHASHPESFQTRLDIMGFMICLLVTNGFMLMTKERVEADLAALRHTDALTGLPAARWLEEAADRTLMRLKQHAQPATLLLIDIDHFRVFNQPHSNARGDSILLELRDLLLHNCPPTSDIYRLQNGNFAILNSGDGIYQAMAYAEALRVAIAGHDFAAGCHITVSGGIAIGNMTDSWATWQSRAQAALAQGKALARNTIHAYKMTFSGNNLPDGIARVGEFLWLPEYTSGNTELDNQHRALFERANVLLQLWARTTDAATISNAVRGFIDLARAHFAYEAMGFRSQSPDPDAEIIRTHIARHDQLLAEAEAHFLRYRERTESRDALFNFLIFSFIVPHTRAEDMEIIKTLSGHEP